jgi:type I restriction enzyme S subunit
MKLKDIAIYAKDRVEIKDLSAHNYISTENMLPEKGGVQTAASLPSISSTSGFMESDVLISNIRPYFKKIWFADKIGGCSNDVLVIRAKENCYSKFLYYILSENYFFDYSTTSAKGTKMPRGDKSAIMEYEVPDWDITEQIKITNILSSLDDKIALNRRINDNLIYN